METTSLIDYLKITDRYYKEEKQRVEVLFTWDVGQEVLKVFRREMLIKPQQTLLSKPEGFQQFLSNQ
jgi:cullin 1